ncbi:MAG: hypothetical protein N2C14_01685, partial [Planctomycetales bacterium]
MNFLRSPRFWAAIISAALLAGGAGLAWTNQAKITAWIAENFPDPQDDAHADHAADDGASDNLELSPQA